MTTSVMPSFDGRREGRKIQENAAAITSHSTTVYTISCSVNLMLRSGLHAFFKGRKELNLGRPIARAGSEEAAPGALHAAAELAKRDQQRQAAGPVNPAT